MPRSSRQLTLLAACLALGAAGLPAAHAVGVGRPQTLSALGQPLSYLVPVQLAADERLSAECVRAEVVAGETRLQAAQVQVQLEGESEATVRALRVRSLVQIDEPVVTVQLSLGCPARFIRQFTVFIDPASDAQPGDSTPPVVVQDFSPALRAALSAAEAKPAQVLAKPTEPVPSPVLAPADPARKPTATKQRTTQLARAETQARAAVRPASPAVVSRLRMDPAELLVAAAPAASTAVAASAPATPDPAAQQRLVQLEQSLQQLLAQQRQSEARIAELQAQLVARQRQAEGSAGTSWAGWIVGLGLLSLLLGVGWFMQWRSRGVQLRNYEEVWWRASQQRGPDSTVAAVPRRPVAAAATATASAAASLADLATPPETEALPGMETSWLAMPPAAGGLEEFGNSPEPVLAAPSAEPISFQLVGVDGPGPARPGPVRVTVEELIDLEQQVDFFLVLGQEQAALERLQSWLGASALPWLRLLALRQRRNERPEFEALAADFALRFTAPAPEWGSDSRVAEGLETRADLVERLQRSWFDRGASMALLHEWLAGPDSAGLSLTAGSDLLMLYAVARDLSEHEVRGEEIDLFLPLEAPATKTSADMMATMVWQGRPGTAAAAAASPIQVDIALDEADAEATTSDQPGDSKTGQLFQR